MLNVKVDKDIKEMMPQFFKRIAEGNVYHYDQAGFTRDLSEEMKLKIKQMEEELKIKKVVAVIETTADFGGEKAHMLAYVFIDTEDDLPWSLTKESVGFMANVINDSWDVEEIGSIGLTERVGCVFRTY